jgi:stage V sporulation protein K
MDLVARDPETTVMKTREVLEEARGGILLIDEAYNLGLASKRKGGGDSGFDAISEIVSGIDGRQEDFPLIILAGFPLDMRAFLAFQPELRKRIPLVLEFPDYSCQELAKIFVDLATAKGFDLDESLTPAHVAQMLEQETTPTWRSERNGRVTEMLLSGVRTELRKRMRRAQLEEQDDFDPHLIVREDVENVMRVEFK